MATKDSEELKANERYPLGDYSFRIERSAGTSPNYDKIEAICTKDGKNARKSIQIPSVTQLDGWYVEANDTTADVYIVINDDEIIPVPSASSAQAQASGENDYLVIYRFLNGSGQITLYLSSNKTYTVLMASSMPGAIAARTAPGHERDSPVSLSSSYTRNEKTVYYATLGQSASSPIMIAEPTADNIIPYDKTAWGMVYGGDSGDGETKLVGRFAIDLEDAGGDGPGSDWIDPGDYDPDWEEGDPTHTLYVTATGALSGRHNDPIVDPSYSYIPADKDTVKCYGCGGDGGHGGGGGAGASTVVIHKFATNQANSKEVTAIARRHGYGSGGGKGGKGGDGCILVYY